MIRRLLIANRGEIVARVARTAHRLGIGTVGVYSEPDAGGLHVDAVDVAVALGGATPAESYLRADAVIDAAIATGADAVHPGYGFLAENAAFAQAVNDAGLIWVGPTADQIRLLGDKLAAKRAAIAAGVPTSPVLELGPISDGDGPAVSDDVIGETPIPALVKAAAGGGGRGMRVVRDRAELADAIASAAREAASAFGDGTVFIEPYVERARHVEVQIIGDRHGNIVHVGERECSIQRRNQKIIEEAPAPRIDEATRTALHDGALALARHVGYENAGTVEFLVGVSGDVQFLEVNTRLQVEHPVTEAVSGLDLVELQLRAAAGEPIGVTQDDITIRGHALEARLVAEDPASGWLPSVGPIARFEVPDDVRTDAGVRAGDIVSPNYDSLLAKVIAHASTREAAAALLGRSLAAAELHGPDTNRDALVAICAEADFCAGETFTSYLDEHPEVVHPARSADGHGTGDPTLFHLAAATAVAERRNRRADGRWGFAPSGWRNLATRGQRTFWTGVTADAPVEVEHRVVSDDANAGCVAYELIIGGARHHVRCWPDATETRPDTASGAIEVDGIRTSFAVHTAGGACWINTPAAQSRLERVPRFVDHDAELAGGGPVAPLPGTITAVAVAEGDDVADGDTLVVLEAMKMEHRITAPAAAVVESVEVAVGEWVDAGHVLVRLKEG